MAKDEKAKEDEKVKEEKEGKEEKEVKETPKRAEGLKKAGKVKGRKRWAPIIAPQSFNNIVLGESHVESAEKLLGKSLTANLMTLTGDMRNQAVEIRFDVIKVQDGKGLAAVTGYEMVPSQLKRLVRRGRSKISDSFIAKTSTGRFVRLKPIVMTANQASSGACTAMRLAVREKAKQLVRGFTFDGLVQEVIGYKLQRVLRDAANTIHPVKSVEIRACVLLPEGTAPPSSDDAEPVNVISPAETAVALQAVTAEAVSPPDGSAPDSPSPDESQAEEQETEFDEEMQEET
jgi:ribosomal protein S3AE